MTNAELQKFVIRKLGITKESFYGDGSQDCGVAFDYQGKVYLVMPDITVHQCIPGGTHVANDYAEQLEKLLRGEQWDGTGLPPVGTECEYEDNTGKWIHVEVVYKSDWVIVIRGKENNIGNGVEIAKDLVMDKLCRFRPLRTERDKAIEQMMSAPKPCGFAIQGICEQIYDAIVAGKIDGLGKVG